MNIEYRGLTAAQLDARKTGIGGSDALRIMSGKWRELWEEKTGRREPEDLSSVLPVQLGQWTEEFNARWYEKQTGTRVDRCEAVTQRTHRHPVQPFMLCNIDGLVAIDGGKRLWEAKHVNPFGSQDDVLKNYYPQMQHCLEVLGLDLCELSVLYGNSGFRRFSVERDADYIGELMLREAEFWAHVERDEPPAGTVPVEPTLKQVRTVDMRRNNMWRDSEATWLQFREAVHAADAAESTLKGMVEADTGFVFGQSLVCARDRAGKLTLRQPNKKDVQRIQTFLQGDPK